MNTMQPLAAVAPIGGVFWSWVVPVLLFGLAFGATWALYRHFAAKPSAGSANGSAPPASEREPR